MDSLHKGAILQQFAEQRVFKGLGVAKRYCTIDSIGDTFMYWEPRPCRSESGGDRAEILYQVM